MRGGFDARSADLVGRPPLEKHILALRVRVQSQFHPAVDDGATACCAAGARERGRAVVQRAVQVEPGLHGDLEDEEHAEDFVADALVGGGEAFGEDVAEAGEAFAEVVVGAGEVEGCEAEGVEGGGGGEGGEVGEEVGLQVVGWGF